MSDDGIDIRFREEVAEMHTSFVRLRKERHPWRDYRGLVHIIRPVVDADNQGNPHVVHWVYVCGLHVLSKGLKVREPEAVVTCLSCLGERE